MNEVENIQPLKETIHTAQSLKMRASEDAPILFRSRISDDEFQSLLGSAKQTHDDYRNGVLLSKHREQCQHQREDTAQHSGEEQQNRGDPATTVCSRSQDIKNPFKRSRVLSRRLQRRIKDSVQMNRVTLIDGPPGSGKSTQVPPLLLRDHDKNSNGGKNNAVLVLQPNRFAVVALAKQAASEMGVPLGGTRVGYHVGYQSLSTQKAQLLFSTPQVVLRNLRENGWDALRRFSVIFVDECHVRSAESDLFLALIKLNFINDPESSLRLVLMSAKLPMGRYQDYFPRHIPGCFTIGNITLEPFESICTHPVETLYLDDIIPRFPQHASFGRLMRIDPASVLENQSLNKELASFLKALVSWLHKSEPHSGAFLVFVPTNRHLDQLRQLLWEDFNVNSLGSVVDVESCLLSVDVDSINVDVKRRVFIATPFAESSLTIPYVSCVIDLCQSVERKCERYKVGSNVIWSSKNSCDQRSGRVGRVGPGKVFRLVYMGFFISELPEWGIAELEHSDCREELLHLVCSQAFNSHSETLLRGCLNPPAERNVKEAIGCLTHLDAIRTSGVGAKIEPTVFGEILAALPFTIQEGITILAGAQLGLLHEIVTMRAICKSDVSPILTNLAEEKAEPFRNSFAARDGESLSAQLRAFIFWDVEWNLKRRVDCDRALWEMNHGATTSGGSNQGFECNGTWNWTEKVEREHVEFCKSHQLNPTAVLTIADIIEGTMNVLHKSRFEPEWLRCGSLTPVWKCRESWRGQAHHKDMLFRVFGADAPAMCAALLALVDNRIDEATKCVSQVRLAHEGEALACIHYLAGKCLLGDRCLYSHDISAKRPRCRFFKASTCIRGKECWYEHECVFSGVPTNRGMELLKAELPVLPLFFVSPKEWFRKNCDNLLLIDENGFDFTAALTKLSIPPLLSSTFVTDGDSRSDRRLGGVNPTKLHADHRIINHVQNKHLDRFAWVLPEIAGADDPSLHQTLLLETFHSLALLRTTIAAPVKWIFAIALQNDQFSSWSVSQCACRVGWRLRAWSTFDHTVFPTYAPRQNFGPKTSGADPRFYVFELEGSL